MKQITKTIAADVAAKMVKATIGKTIQSLEEKIAERGDQVIKNSIPSILLDAMYKYPKYFNKTTSIRLISDTIRCEYRFLCKSPFPSNGEYCRFFDVNRETLDWFIDKGDELKMLNIEAKRMLNQIESTLFALRTTKRIEAEFEAAVEYLPVEKEESGIALPIEELNMLINKYK